MRFPAIIGYIQVPELKAFLRNWAKLKNPPMYFSQKTHALRIYLALKDGSFLLLNEERLQRKKSKRATRAPTDVMATL